MSDFFEYLAGGIDTEQFIIFVIAGICIWLLLREVKCWYWKINTLIRNQELQVEMLDAILFELRTQNIRRHETTNNPIQEANTEESKSTP